MVPDFLVIGGVIADRTPSGLRVGGAAAYSALTASKLGLRVALVTNPHTVIDVAAALPEITFRLVGKPVSTTFRNVLTPNGRTQFWEGRGARIRPQDIPRLWREATVVHIATVAQDVDPTVVGQFHGGLVGVTPPGLV